MQRRVLVIDVAHPPRSADTVEQELMEGWTMVRNSGGLRLLKVIHGHGSTGRGGSTKTVARNWAFRFRGKFRSVIEGERYSLYDAGVQEMLGEVGQVEDDDLRAGNPGITIIWVK